MLKKEETDRRKIKYGVKQGKHAEHEGGKR
jgi:hypothetical protein